MFVLPIDNDLDADNRTWDVIGLIALNSAIASAGSIPTPRQRSALGLANKLCWGF
jgi:hypothetical protein